MPPSREYKLVFKPERIADLEAELKLRAPCRIKTEIIANDAFYGKYFSDLRLIKLSLGCSLYTGSRLTHVKNNILETLLHEYRHAHQWDNWDEKKLREGGIISGGDLAGVHWNDEMEEDAESWALANRDKWRDLFTIRPTMHSNLSKLSQAEARVR